MQLRQLEYLVALARERHFGRAAAACSVTQPTLSSGIKELERELDVPLVRRGTRFESFTPEGERVLRRAHLILAERDALASDAGGMKAELSGRLRIAAIPTALTTMSLLVTPFTQANPKVKVSVASNTSRAIASQLAEFAIDLGITYVDNDPLPANLSITRLYRERYVLLTRHEAFASRSTVGWSEVAELPLCLLTPDMQNRRILDALFAEANAHPSPVVETNSISTLYAMVREGTLSSVVAHAWLHLFGLPKGLHAVPMTRPRATRWIGIVALDREPRSIVGRAMVEMAGSLDLQGSLDHLLEA